MYYIKGAQIEAPRKNGWIRLVGYIKRKRDERTAKKQKETPTDKAARRTAVATIWMAIFTFVLAATSALTIWILKNQLKKMHEGGVDTHDLAVAAKKQADKTSAVSDAADKIKEAAENLVIQEKRIADNATKSLRSANRQAILSQRPWISTGVHVYVVPDEKGNLPANPLIVGKNLDVQAGFRNTGRTPAINARSAFLRTWRQSRNNVFEPPDFTYSFTHPGTITPDELIYLDQVGLFSDSQPVLTQDDKQLIESPNFRVFYHGRIEYDDVFGGQHWKNFCQFLLPSGALRYCPYHNDVDNNPN